MSNYAARKLQTREELDAVVDVIFKAQYSPYMPSTSIFFPVSGYLWEDHAAGVAASKERLWKEHLALNTANNHWIIVEEKSTSKIIGGCLWKWHDSNPFPDGIPKPHVYWWPEGEVREFCEEMIRQSMTPRRLWMHGRNAGLKMMVVHPAHRSRGVGGLMMEWANARIDEMGIEGSLRLMNLAGDCTRSGDIESS